MWLFINVVFVSRVQPSVSVIHTHVSVLFSKFFSHLSCFIILNKVSCATLVIHCLAGEGAALSLHCGPRALCRTQAFPGCAWGFSLVVLWGFCCSAHRLPSCGMQPLECVSSVVAMCRLSGPAACGIFPSQGWNSHPLHLKADS